MMPTAAIFQCSCDAVVVLLGFDQSRDTNNVHSIDTACWHKPVDVVGGLRQVPLYAIVSSLELRLQAGAEGTYTPQAGARGRCRCGVPRGERVLGQKAFAPIL